MPKPTKSSWRRVLAFVVAALVMPTVSQAQAINGWTESQKAKRATRYALLTPEAVARLVVVQDDDLEPIARLSTERTFAFKGGFTDRVRADAFLRAFMVRKTGRTTFELYERLSYTGNSREFHSANYAGTDGPVAATLTISDTRLSCPHAVCIHDDTLAFEVPEALLRMIAARATADPWRFRFKSRVGEDWTDDVSPAEIAGLLLAVDRYRRARGLLDVAR